MPSLEQLLKGVSYRILAGDADCSLGGLSYDSRLVQPGDAFVAITGFKQDGHSYLEDAARRGARAAVLEKEVPLPAGIAAALVENSRVALAEMAANMYGHPSRELFLVGVTGTNGKTTTANLAAALLERAGMNSGVIGTLGSRMGERDFPSQHTTPESLDLQRLLREMRNAGAQAVAMEVSSHALVLQRVQGAHFGAAIFTNLTQDHLDFHQSLQEYLEAKALLFRHLAPDGLAVLNRDDPACDYLRSLTPARVVTYGLGDGCDVRGSDLDIRSDGSSYTVAWAGGSMRLRLRLTGQFNVYNSLAVFALAMGRCIAPEIAAAALAEVSGVPGRLELVPGGRGFAVLVDYAHTPDGLENVLRAARQITTGQLITVFGCGGDRDRSKRPLMGRVAARLSDRVVVTSDNPRSEDPGAIIEEIMPGLAEAVAPPIVEPDRRQAIGRAVALARPGDTVLIAGKGHETHQIIGDRVLPFDDRKVAREILAAGGDGYAGED